MEGYWSYFVELKINNATFHRFAVALMGCPWDAICGASLCGRLLEEVKGRKAVG